ncbi:MAG: hypothetical protein ACYCW6_06565 [Candidatus Xenobia bacterium]
MNILNVSPAAPGTTPTSKPAPRSITETCHDAFVRSSEFFSQVPPPAAASLKGALLGAGCTTAGAILGLGGPAGLILGGALGMGLGASVQIDRQGWNESYAGQGMINAAGAKFFLSVLGAGAGVGLTALGANFPVSATVLAAGVGGAAMGFAYRQMIGE